MRRFGACWCLALSGGGALALLACGPSDDSNTWYLGAAAHAGSGHGGVAGGAGSGAGPSKDGGFTGASPGGFGGADGGSGVQGQPCSPGTTRSCYPFSTGKDGVGACKAGTQPCSKSGEFGQWGDCAGAVGPSPDECGDGIDNDCDGVVDKGCATEPSGPEAGAPIDAQIEFHHLPDTASWTNCLKIQVNGGPETDLGCNKGAPLLTASVVAKAPPFCNIVRLNLYSNGAFNKTTANAATVADSFIIQQIGPGNFRVQCNDNSDDDYNDLNLTMNAVGDVKFTIENSGFPCQ